MTTAAKYCETTLRRVAALHVSNRRQRPYSTTRRRAMIDRFRSVKPVFATAILALILVCNSTPDAFTAEDTRRIDRLNALSLRLAEERANISILTNVAIKQIEAQAGKVTGITWEKRDTGNVETTPLAGVFVQIGLLPNSQMVAGQLEITAHGEVVIDDKCGTSAPGVYACGDVTTVPYKQIVVSIGEGAKAALAAFEYLLVGTDVAT